MLKRVCYKLLKPFNNWRKRKLVFIHKTAKIEDISSVVLQRDAEIWEYVIIRAGVKMEIGESSQIGPFTVIFGGNEIKIGKNVIIAPHCVIAAGNHDYSQTSIPMRFSSSISKGPIIIHDNVWIGANCTITDNVTIGKDAVIGANSVVTKNIEPFGIYAGVPAIKIGERTKP
jgi:acetyltransferase-like isoleucine patch superfamily enzyme